MKMLCAMTTCQNSGANNVAPEKGVLFHPFPTNRDVKAEWIDMAGLTGKHLTKKHFLCSRHFRDSDYIIKRSGKKYLKVSAVPCEYVVYPTLPPYVASWSGHLNETKIKMENEPKQDAAEKESAHIDQTPKVIVVPQPDFDIQMAEPESKVVVVPQPEFDIQMAEPEPKVVEVQEPELKYDVQMANQPGTSRGSGPSKRTTSKRPPDSTIGTIYDVSDTSVGRWQFQPDRYFGSRCPTRIFDENSQDVDSSEFDERYRRELSMNLYPPISELELNPHLADLPPPRSPEPVLPIIQAPESNVDMEENLPKAVFDLMNPYPPIFEQELNPHLADLPPPRSPEPVLPIIQAPESNVDLEENLPKAVFDLVRNQRKLDDIMKIVTHHKSSKKAVAAAIAEVLEARNVKDQLQSGKMTSYEQAAAVIALQYRHIVKLEIKYRKLKKMVKRVSNVLHRVG